MTFAKRLASARKAKGVTQSDVAEKLHVSFQAVSLWERGETTPEFDKLADIGVLYDVSLDWLLTGKQEDRVLDAFQDDLADRLFNEERMYTYVKTYANAKNLYDTAKALPFAREMHKGQVRKGESRIPYIYHPLLVACHGISLGLDDDAMIAAALLHDVCEDCGVEPKDLPVGDVVKEAIALLTKTKGYDKDAYFQGISENPIATMVKLLDRCSNVSEMASAFSKEKLVKYIRETEEAFYPLMKKAKEAYPMYANQIFLIRYHIKSVVEAIKRLY